MGPNTKVYLTHSPASLVVLLVAFFEAPETAALVPVRRADRALGPPRTRQADEVEQRLLLRRRRRGHVVVEAPGVGFWDVPVGDGDDAYALPAAERPRDLDHVARLDLTVRLRRLAIDVNLPAATGPLRLRSRLEQTRDIEPDVESEGVRSVFHRSAILGDRSQAMRRPDALPETCPLLELICGKQI